ncbi:Crp/Fnr family transcriptional regulator [Streptomyces sp. NPDC012461]|uniref:Crp/Fnr family transcriptional regulator n=1 Tax=Streptomyces sp. SID7958 TaxID=2706093 RepID=A0A6G3TWJ2_9ACTN|nr:Crp/Fnr family transcriptional regulator [Streptomyces sp. S12]NEC30358.1 Crp/Fnr family transcriptional regulator [Streptomyces sp. SID8111]NEC30490.1 Crp/Fnr family transcriptional regulator [Streptomyces sp. SID8111]NEC78494.1 Crp/Fnr family transcriptional regulator [Streptomyces sp. SID7958]NED16630.1 Crp/Fnr family transcriptional regulator [Streptomyces sp. SID9913]
MQHVRIGKSALYSHLLQVVENRKISLTPINLERGYNLYTCGESIDDLFLIVQGGIKLTTSAHSGKECILDICRRGDILGALSLVPSVHEESATAMLDSRVLRINRREFIRILRSDPDLFQSWSHHLAQRIRQRESTIKHLVTMKCEYRLAAILLHLSDRFAGQKSQWQHIDARITHDELAAMVGTTRSRIGFFLKNFNVRGLVKRLPDGTLLVNSGTISAFIATDPNETEPVLQHA